MRFSQIAHARIISLNFILRAGAQTLPQPSCQKVCLPAMQLAEKHQEITDTQLLAIAVFRFQRTESHRAKMPMTIGGNTTQFTTLQP